MVQPWFISQVTSKKTFPNFCNYDNMSFLQIPHATPQLKQNGSKLEPLQNKTTIRQVQFHSDIFIQVFVVQLVLSPQKQMQFYWDFYFHKPELRQQSLRYHRMPVTVFWKPSYSVNFLCTIYSNQFSFSKNCTASSNPFWYNDSIFSWFGGNKAWLSLTKLARDSCNRARSYKLVY